MSIYTTNFGWESELDALAELSDEDAANTINAKTNEASGYVFGSFRTFAALLTSLEYNTLRAVLDGAAATEKAAGGTLITDMIVMLSTPGNEHGDGGGIDFNSAAFIAMLGQLSGASEDLKSVPDKIAAYTLSKQGGNTPKYPFCAAGQVKTARANIQS
jgi:hypothetical protein